MPPHILFWNDSLDFGFVSLSLSQTLVFCFANITLERTETTRKTRGFSEKRAKKQESLAALWKTEDVFTHPPFLSLIVRFSALAR